MSYDSVIDPLSAAGIADAAVARALDALRVVLTARETAVASAEAAAVSRAAVTALLAGLGVPHRWSGTVLQIRLPDGNYGAAVDLEGPRGPPGRAPNVRIGTVTTGELAVVAHLDDPANPVLDFVLQRGPAAWTPVPAAVSDGARSVLQIVDWTGGGGAKPAAGLYVGAAGLVSAVAAAVDLRGPPGAGGTVTHTGAPAAGHLAVFGADGDHIADGGTLSSFGQGLVAAASAAAVKALLSIAAGDVSGLGGAATRNVGTSSGTVAAGDDARITGAEQAANRGQASGYAGLDVTGKVPTAQLPASVLGDVRYAGAWNASTNVPAIPAASSANMGQYYVVQTAGTTTISGQSDWQVGDWLVSNGASWDKIDNTDAVKSVAGLVGAVTAAALKIALAIGSGDLADATPTGRSILTAASAAAVKATLAIAAGDVSGLGGAATRNVGTSSGTVAAGDDSRFAAAFTRGQIVAMAYGDPLNFF